MRYDAALKHTEGAMRNRSRSGVNRFKFSYIQRDQKLQPAAASATRAPVTRIKDGSGWKYVIEDVLDETEDQVLIKWAGFDASHNSWEPTDAIPPLFITVFKDKLLHASRISLKDRHQQRCKTYRFKGVDVMLNEGDEQFVTDVIREYAADIIAGIKNRFPNGSSSVLERFDIFHLEFLPDTVKL